MEDLSHDQGDPHDQEVSAHDAGGVNATGPASHDARWMRRPLRGRYSINNFTEVDDNFLLPLLEKFVRAMCGIERDPDPAFVSGAAAARRAGLNFGSSRRG